MTPSRKPKKLTRKQEHARLLTAHRHLYEPLLALQNGGCALCGSPPLNRKLDLDHDHKAMKVRGLLCVRCNRAVMDQQPPEWHRKVADYLENPPADKLLATEEEGI